ncbi:hypothetical protein GCM10009676_28550 [Prauserella halophila]|uniref:Uncharacterized protein n=1 Tax=Prauserella halophila TaxID=185641 RepID=A0ABP4H2J2_9PSEU|nr:hypothetical protein [Prauserella halophila]MCP2236916.1 hypothetical protein [Prauserella halophila]
MNQPYPGGYPQQPGGPGQFGRPGPYGHPGGPGYGHPQAGFAPRKPSTAMAYVTAIAFLLAIAILYLSATMSIDLPESEFAAYMRFTMTGFAFLGMPNDNADAIIAVTYSYPSTLLLFVVLLFARIGFARWVAAGLGLLGFAYYVFALIKYLAIGYEATIDGTTVGFDLPAEFSIFPAIVALVLLGGSIMAVLPATGRAMRGGKPKQPQGPSMGPPGYGPPGYPPPGSVPPGSVPPGYGP